MSRLHPSLGEDQLYLFDRLTILQQDVVTGILSGLSRREAYAATNGKARTPFGIDQAVRQIMHNDNVKAFMKSVKEGQLSNAVYSFDEKRQLLMKLMQEACIKNKDADGNTLPIHPQQIMAVRACIAEDNKMMGHYNKGKEENALPSVIIVPDELTKEEALKQYALPECDED